MNERGSGREGSFESLDRKLGVSLGTERAHIDALRRVRRVYLGNQDERKKTHHQRGSLSLKNRELMQVRSEVGMLEQFERERAFKSALKGKGEDRRWLDAPSDRE